MVSNFSRPFLWIVVAFAIAFLLLGLYVIDEINRRPGGITIRESIINRAFCIREGERGNSFRHQYCCNGLKEIAVTVGEPPHCGIELSGGFFCTKCGDSMCSPGENSCNCSQDCH